VTTLFPQYDFARQIAGDKAEITLLLPPGAESHSFEPTPADIINISNADLFTPLSMCYCIGCKFGYKKIFHDW